MEVIFNHFGFGRVHLDMTITYNEAQKGYLLNMELTLLKFDEQMVSHELLED